MTRLKGQFLSPHEVRASWGEEAVQALANPAAGANIVIQGDPHYVTIVRALKLAFTTSAQVAERELLARIVKRGVTVYEMALGPALAAGKANVYSLIAAETPNKGETQGGRTVGWLPDLLLKAGDELIVTAAGIQTEDQFSAIGSVLERFERNPHHESVELQELASHLHRLQEAMRGGPSVQA